MIKKIPKPKNKTLMPIRIPGPMEIPPKNETNASEKI